MTSRAYSGGLKDQDRIFQNIFGEHDTSIKVRGGRRHSVPIQERRVVASLAVQRAAPLARTAVQLMRGRSPRKTPLNS